MQPRKIGYFIKSINDRIKVKADAGLAGLGITLAQSRVLGFLSQNGGSATQKEIECHLEVSHPTVVGIVSRMTQNGFLECSVDGQDKRNKLVCMTPKARSIAGILTEQIAMQEEYMTRSLSDGETAELIRLLGVIYRDLN